LDQVYQTAMQNEKLQVAVNAIITQAKIGGLFDPKPQDEVEQARWIEAEVKDFSKVDDGRND
jgi:hypothetical protein